MYEFEHGLNISLPRPRNVPLISPLACATSHYICQDGYDGITHALAARLTTLCRIGACYWKGALAIPTYSLFWSLGVDALIQVPSAAASHS
jgi:hypothetical protein